jgi:hypothetical protein
VSKKRLELTDVRPDELSGRRLARWLKNAAIYGFRAGPVYPLADTPETPRALAERMIVLREYEAGRWQALLVTGTGSIIRFLDEYPDREAALCGQVWWVEVFALALEWGGRLYRLGEMEIKG